MALPTDIAGLYAWYRASSYAQGDGTQIVTNWGDSSGNGRTLTVTTAGGGPKFRASMIAGYPAVELVGSGYFSNPGFGWDVSLANHTIFVVFYTTNNTAQNPVFTAAAGSTAEGFRAGGGGNATSVWARTDAPWSYTAAQALTTNVWHYGYSAQTNGSQISISLDAAVATTTALAGTRAAVGADARVGLDGGAYWNAGFVAEIIVYTSNLSAGNKTLLNTYLRDKYFSAAPGQQEQLRDVLSRRLWMRRRPTELEEFNAPLWLLDAEIGERLAMEMRTAPAPSAAGWGARKWSRPGLTMQRVELIPGEKRLKVSTLNRRNLDVRLWDTACTQDVNASARQAGVARLLRGIGFTFARQSMAWIENPADPTALVQCSNQARAITRKGEYLEEARTNEILRSSGVSGGTGLTLAGTGTNGSAIAVDTTDLLFDQVTSANSLKFTAGSPHAAELRVTFPATASWANTPCRVTIDHKTDSGEGLYWRLQRSVDSNYWNDTTPGWQAGSVDNACATSATRNPDNRTISKAVTMDGTSRTLTLAIFLQTGGTAGRISHLYHAQIERGTFPTSRIVTDGAAVTRVKTELSHSVTTAAKIFDPALGSFYCEMTPDWSSADLGSTEDMYVWWMTTNGGADHMALYYDASAAGWVFEAKVGANTYQATKAAAVTRGTLYKIGCRWTGVEAELGLTAYTLSVFVDGVKGTDATAAAPTFTSPETWYRGSDSSFAHQANGAIREWRVFPAALTDEEIARLP